MGAPVTAFLPALDRSDPSPQPALEPDAVLVVDAILPRHVDVFAGLAPDGYVIVNYSRSPEELGLADLGCTVPTDHVVKVPATDLARAHTGKPVPNVAMLGGFTALTGRVTKKSLEDAMCRRFGEDVGTADVAHCGPPSRT